MMSSGLTGDRRDVSWIVNLRVIAWYLHLSYFVSGNKGSYDAWPRPASTYDPDIYVFEARPDDKMRRGKGLREDVNKDVASTVGHCAVCGLPASDDHIISLRDEYSPGDDSPFNFMPLCKEHNSSKGNHDLLEWTANKMGSIFWMYAESEKPVIIKSGGYIKANGNGVGRNIMRLYLHSRYQYLKKAGRLTNIAPDFVPRYISMMESELFIPAHISGMIYQRSIQDRLVDEKEVSQ